MASDRKTDEVRVCPRTGRRIDGGGRYRWVRWVFPLAGLVSLIWFLVRVVPKPSRASYPCQRFAAPLAGGFVIWLTGIVGSMLAYRQARRLLGQSRYLAAGVLLAVSVAAIWISVTVMQEKPAGAAFTPSDAPNRPIGVAQGLHPGRVVWMHEPRAANWNQTTGAWWDDANTDQLAVNHMVSKSLRTYTGEPNDAAAWDALFRYFNRTRGLGDVGYTTGEKIAIKINMNQDSGNTWSSKAGMPSPQMLYSLIDQLIHVAGVPGSAITIYDAARYIGDPLYKKIHSHPDPEFQKVTFVVRPNLVKNGRVAARDYTPLAVRFSNSSNQAFVPHCAGEAKYLINMALLRAHSLFGVTACAKNHFGSLHFPNTSSNGGWTPSPVHNYGNRSQAMGTYCCLVDLIGHPHLGGKTLLYMIDGLYAAKNQSAEVIRFLSFGDKWTSSIFLSQDPVAIDSVALDFIRSESRQTDCTGPGVDNYMHEAALANDPPSKTIYDPDGDGIRLGSLGVHEHWNNATDRKYSRNLGTGQGIELVIPPLTSENGPVENVTRGLRYDDLAVAVQDANDGDTIVVSPGTYRETVDFQGKRLLVRSQDPNDPAVVAATIIEGTAQAAVFSHREDANCVLAGFTITGAADGIYCNNASPTILNCRIIGNLQAGIRMGESCSSIVANCIIEGNGGPGLDMTPPAGGRFVKYSDPVVVHCVIVGNGREGVKSGKPVIVNSILRDNGVGGTVPQVSAANAVVNYCNIEGGYEGTGNISQDPCFMTPSYWADPADANVPAAPDNATAVWIGGDYHLREESPCIDAGDPTFILGQLVADIDGQPRVIGDRLDIGCDEFASKKPEPTPLE